MFIARETHFPIDFVRHHEYWEKNYFVSFKYLRFECCFMKKGCFNYHPEGWKVRIVYVTRCQRERKKGGRIGEASVLGMNERFLWPLTLWCHKSRPFVRRNKARETYVLWDISFIFLLNSISQWSRFLLKIFDIRKNWYFFLAVAHAKRDHWYCSGIDYMQLDPKTMSSQQNNCQGRVQGRSRV